MAKQPVVAQSDPVEEAQIRKEIKMAAKKAEQKAAERASRLRRGGSARHSRPALGRVSRSGNACAQAGSALQC
jgi:hypothetical protein